MIFFLACLSALSLGATAPAPLRRPFQFPSDTFAYANQLICEYQVDPASGRTMARRRVPKPDYTLRCFVLVRAARQFYDHSRFEPAEPKADHATYQHLVRAVLQRSPRSVSSEKRKIVIPGYANLRDFSREQEPLLKDEGGGAWQSFVQRGNWRMVFPFSRRQQDRTAHELSAALRERRPLPVHLVCFPSLALNHALLLIAAKESAAGLEFTAYDPNDCQHSIELRYDQSIRTFYLPTTAYFAGGPVNVYPIYHGLCY